MFPSRSPKTLALEQCYTSVSSDLAEYFVLLLPDVVFDELWRLFLFFESCALSTSFFQLCFLRSFVGGFLPFFVYDIPFLKSFAESISSFFFFFLMQHLYHQDYRTNCKLHDQPTMKYCCSNWDRANMQWIVSSILCQGQPSWQCDKLTGTF